MIPRKTKEQFIEEAKQVHNNKYDYSKVEYKNARTKVCIICPEHGEFWQTPDNHLKGYGCPKCAAKKRGAQRRLTTEQFIKKAKQIHGDKYDYSKVEYITTQTPVCIICPIHGDFYMAPNNHISINSQCGCPKCAYEHTADLKRKTLKRFIEQAKNVHGDKYDYSKVEYYNGKEPVCIICKECGTEFWQAPNNHLTGKGCPNCAKSKGELQIKRFLEEHNIQFINDQPCIEWLAPQRPDFYLLDYNLVIEYDGEQHFKAREFFGGEKALKHTQELDARKNSLCEEHGVKIVRISYKDFNQINTILSDMLLR